MTRVAHKHHWLLAPLLGLLLAFPVAAQDEAAGEADDDLEAASPAKTPDEIHDDLIVSKKRDEAKADQLRAEGEEAFLIKKYEEAEAKLKDAERLYNQVSQDSPRVVEKSQAVRRRLGQVYMEWSQSMVADAMKKVEGEQFDDARKRLDQAKAHDPALADLIASKQREVDRAEERTEFRRATSDEMIDPEAANRARDIARLLEGGRRLYERKHYMRAREQYEQVLIKDPYNIEAAKAMRMMYVDLLNDAQRRRWIMIQERLAEIEWKWVDPVPPAEVGGPAAPALVSTIPAANRATERKLKEIIIPNISFTEATIETVVRHLKDRSKQLDPENEGINILLLMPEAVPGGGAAAPTAAPAPADPFGGDFGFDAAPVPDPGAGAAPMGSGTRLITMEFDNIPLGDAIRYICQGADLVFRVESHAVIIADRRVPIDPMETRFFTVSPAILDVRPTRESTGGLGDDSGGGSTREIQELRVIFEEFGVEFPQGSSIRYEARVSKLIVTQTPENLRKIETILNELIDAPLQVTIEAKFVEVRQNTLDELGFDWLFLGKQKNGQLGPARQKFGDLRVDVKPQGGTDPGAGSLAEATRHLHSTNLLAFDAILDGVQLTSLLYWFDRKDGTDILSAPKVTTVSGQTAVIRMVEERRFPESFSEPEFNTTDGVTSFTPPTPEFGGARDIGVILTVTPTIDAQDKYTIVLELSPEVLEFIGFDTSFNTSAVIEGIPVELRFDVPIVERRAVETRVNIWDGETVVLGGTIRDKIEKIDDRVPILGDLPLIGRLFRSIGERSEKKNLLIFVSGRIVNPAGLPLRPIEVRGLPEFRR